jgi:hypothetical protein
LDQLLAFAQDRWYLVAAAVIILLIVVRIVKTVVKWIIVLAVVAALFVYGANYKDKLQTIGATVGEKVVNEVSDQAVKALKDEAKDAKYTANADGSFTITTKSAKLEGKPGSDEVRVTFMGKTFPIKADQAINAFIEQAKKNSK